MTSLPKRQGLPLVVCAPSGAGKSTLIDKLCQEFSLKYSVSCTTRLPRPGEINGVHYFFLDKPDFLYKLDQGYFAEWAVVHDNYYGTPLKTVRHALGQGQDLVFDIDVYGAAQLRLTLPGTCFAFILPPSLEALEQRLQARGTDDSRTIALRLANAKNEIANSHWFDAVIVNDNLDTAFDEFRAFYLACCRKPVLNPRLAGTIIRNR